ncbi:MAG: hypothetical protein HY691_05930, partial [Chloroflexi bacterium]|nr:hypothetical protein [Chloroflexota bacterium]
GYHVHIFADRQTPPTPADLGTVLHMATDFGPLGPGQAQTVVTSLGAGILSAGEHTLWALADGHNAIAELNEANNVATFMLDVVSGNRLAFLAAPVRAAHSYDFGIQPVVVLRDSGGVTLTADSTTVVTLSIKPDSGLSDAVLSCDQTVNSVTSMRVTSGVAAFSGCLIDRPGVGYVLEARAADAQPGETLTFNVTWAGDSNGDGRVSIVDYSLAVTCFGAAPGDPRWDDPALRCGRADLNGDMVVDVVDHSIVVTRFGTATGTPVAPSGPGAGP